MKLLRQNPPVCYWGCRLRQVNLYDCCKTVVESVRYLGVICVDEGSQSFTCTGDVSHTRFLANVNSRSRSLYAVAHPSVVCLSVCRLSVCNARAPYSADCNSRQYFYGVRYLGHPLTSTENLTEIVPGEPLRWGS